MISGVAFCPQPPLLVPDLARGAAAELDDVRAACHESITRVSDSRQVVLLGPGPASSGYLPGSRGTLAGFGLPGDLHLGAPTGGGHPGGMSGAAGGVDLPAVPLPLPLSLTVGAWLVQDALGPRSGAVGYSVGPDFAGSRLALELSELTEAQDVALIVLGDGSARRNIKAPGYFDERAAAFDASVATALSSGDGAALGSLDAGLAAQLLATGVPAWQAAGAMLAGSAYDATLLYDRAPYGVGYFVALWTAHA